MSEALVPSITYTYLGNRTFSVFYDYGQIMDRLLKQMWIDFSQNLVRQFHNIYLLERNFKYFYKANKIPILLGYLCNISECFTNTLTVKLHWPLSLFLATQETCSRIRDLQNRGRTVSISCRLFLIGNIRRGIRCLSFKFRKCQITS